MKEKIVLTAHSEYLPIDSMIIRPVKNAFISNPRLATQWEGLNFLAQPVFEKAKEEYAIFQSIITTNCSSVVSLPKDESLSLDAIYCRDASIATDHGMILCNMGKAERLGEPESLKNTYSELGIPILGSIRAPGTLEGGDIAWLDQRTLAVGHSYRTNSEGIRQLKALLKPYSIEIMVVDLPHYKGKSDVFHLMSLLSPVDRDLVVIYSPLMPIGFRDSLIQRGFTLVEVPEEEFYSMGCNVLALSPRKCLLVRGNPVTEERLLLAGCEVLTYPGEEISQKGGGGPTCLTRPVYRVAKATS